MVPKIQCVCGFGCGSSLMLRMAIDDILKKNNLEADTFTGDVATCLTNDCDVIFISKELSDQIIDRATMPVITIDDFLNPKEIEEKTEQENEILLENGNSVVDTSDNVPQDNEDRCAEIMDYIEIDQKSPVLKPCHRKWHDFFSMLQCSVIFNMAIKA